MPAPIGKSQHYLFAHLMLPIIALGNPRALHKELGRGRAHATRHLLRLWEGLGKKSGKQESAQGLTVFRRSIGEDSPVDVIQMPPPTSPTEAFYVGIYYTIKRSFLARTATSARYFTLELGLSPPPSQVQYYFCEWVGVFTPEHRNYGRLRGTDLGDFLGAISDITAEEAPSIYVRPNDTTPDGPWVEQTEDAERYSETGIRQVEQGDFVGALRSFSRVAALAPHGIDVRYNLGKVKLNLADYDGAIADLTAALKIDHRNADAYNNRGIAYKKVGNLAAAVRDYTMALWYDEKLYQAYFNRALALLLMNDHEKALADLRTAARYGVAAADLLLKELDGDAYPSAPGVERPDLAGQDRLGPLDGSREGPGGMAPIQDRRLLSQQEIHAFGIDIAVEHMRDLGYHIEFVNPNQDGNPQILARLGSRLVFVLVRTACHPLRGQLESQALLDGMLAFAAAYRTTLLFASVGIANADGTTDAEKSIAIRGAPYQASLSGLTELRPGASLDAMGPMGAYNANGNVAVLVKRFSDGRHQLISGPAPDSNAVVMAIFITFAEDLAEPQRAEFSSWAGLPPSAWTTVHRVEFGLAMMHWALRAKECGANVPEEVARAFTHLQPQPLKPLPRALTPEVEAIFESLFAVPGA